MIETIILKTIGLSLLKAVISKAGFKPIVTTLGTAFDVHSIFHSLHSVNSSRDLGVIGLQVGYGQLSDRTIEYLVNKIGEDRYEIKSLENGLYVAETRLASQPIFLANYSEFRALTPSGFNNVRIFHKSEHRVSAGLKGSHVKAHKPMAVKRDHRKS